MCWLRRRNVYKSLLRQKFYNIYYRTCSTSKIDTQKPKHFSEIPGPLSLPLIGTLYQYLPIIGKYKFDTIHKNGFKKHKLFGEIIREEIAPGQNIVWLLNPADFEVLFRTEGPYPSRTSHLALKKYRLDKPHVYNTGGLLPTNGPEWQRLRKIFQKGLSGPADSVNFIEGSNDIIQEWIDTRIDYLSTENDIDYLPELSRLFLELIGYGAFDMRFDCFYEAELLPNSRTSKLIDSAFVTNSSVLKTDNGLKVWKKFETPLYRRLKKAQDYMESVAIDLLAFKMSTFHEKQKNCPATLLDKYLSSDKLDFKDIIGISCDFLLAGIDTATYTTSFVLYHIAKNPNAQDALYKEACKFLPQSNSSVTPKMYAELEYAKCVLKESLRLRPVSVGIGRTLNSDVVFSGYLVPKGTIVVTLNEVACRLEKHFDKPDEFIPERWLRSNSAYEANVSKFLVTPFGHGQRTCIAKRFAEQNMVLLLLKLVRTYRLTWTGAEIDSKSLLINKPDGPIALRLEKR